MKKEKFDMSISREPTRIVRRRRRRKKAIQRLCITLLILTTILVPAGFFGIQFYLSHFNQGTTINGIDCSWLTTEAAFDKLIADLQQTEIRFSFEKPSGFSISSDILNLTFDDSLEEMLAEQKKRHTKKFSFSSFSFDEAKLKELLENEIQAENRLFPENASVVLTDDLLQIIPEMEGNFIPVQEAYELACRQLRAGNWSVDLTSLIMSEPEITSADLAENVEEINSILKTSITFTIKKGCTLTLDKSVMRDWLVLENGNYFLDVEANLPRFVESLQETCEANMPVSIAFQGTGDVGTYSIPAYHLSLDVEAELAFIQEKLGTGEAYNHQPVYNLDMQSYVEVDITRQHVWFYKDGVCVVESDCVTGTANGERDTSRGYFLLENKILNKPLRGPGYATLVSYWMPFNGGQGLHDSTRSRFGGDIYLTNGSHGCVNLPPDVAKTIFENITISTPVIVYASSN